MTTLNSKGEVCDIQDENQFSGGHTAFACVAFCALALKYAGQPGHGATGTGQEIANAAYYWYGREEGSSAASNTNGMSLAAMYDMLHGLGMPYYPSSIDMTHIKAWLRLGYPLILCGAETGMHDLDLGDAVPYGWPPSGSHAIIASGIASDGNLLVHDMASIAPTGVRPGPRRYDVAKLQLISATAIRMPWLPEQPAGFDPTKGVPHSVSGVPANWRDDGHVLYSPNTKQGGPEIPITGAFRDYILANPWPNGNVALEEGHHVSQLELSNAELGSGFQQTFRWAMLAKPDTGSLGGKVVYEWVGEELFVTRQHLAQANFDLATTKNQLAQAQAQIAQEQQELTSLKQELSGKPDVAALSNRFSAIGMLAKQASDLLAEAQQQAAQPIS